MACVNLILRRARRVLAVTVVVVVLLVVAFLFYSSMVMMGDRTAAVKAWSNPAVTITSTGHSVVLEPTGEASGSGLVFIPGAKVDPYAYLYKLAGIVESSGVTVVITKPTLNLAFFDLRPLSLFEADAPDVTRWFVGGHSLGGVRACQLAESPGAGAEVAGLVLFGSYCANNLSDSNLDVLSIGGSEDGLSTPGKIRDASHLLPGQANLVQVDGLNHAGFGDYGTQPGDGTATLTSDQERDAITELLQSVVGRNVR
ncbi:alpha/beta hydrolase [Salinibacterium xinjiangense]|uniref:alpha/beta hydrolase n=1 Tax=Salinibacterium xinjiangense TaxID=386302 RepID=UPI000BE34A0D|nr:alpha/beta hydrolase [Salinibacterium xinjiangense]GGL01241.1 alpha/beta hydrolase [Salinibacterium xinjiangense]